MVLQEKLLTTLEELVKPEHTGIVVVDMLNDFCHRDGFLGKGGHDSSGAGQEPADLSSIEEMTPKLLHLIETARSAGVKVYFVRMIGDDHYLPPMARLRKFRIGRTQILCPEGKWGSEQFDGFIPQPEDTVITKHVNSAFIGTNFKDILEKDKIRSLIVTGVATHICCESTIRDGAMMGFYIIVPRDCVAACVKEAHEQSLAQIDFTWGWVTTSEEIIANWQKR